MSKYLPILSAVLSVQISSSFHEVYGLVIDIHLYRSLYAMNLQYLVYSTKDSYQNLKNVRMLLIMAKCDDDHHKQNMHAKEHCFK